MIDLFDILLRSTAGENNIGWNVRVYAIVQYFSLLYTQESIHYIVFQCHGQTIQSEENRK